MILTTSLFHSLLSATAKITPPWVKDDCFGPYLPVTIWEFIPSHTHPLNHRVSSMLQVKRGPRETPLPTPRSAHRVLAVVITRCNQFFIHSTPTKMQEICMFITDSMLQTSHGSISQLLNPLPSGTHIRQRPTGVVPHSALSSSERGRNTTSVEQHLANRRSETAIDTVDAWNPGVHQLRWVVAPITCRVSYIPGVFSRISEPSTVTVGRFPTGGIHQRAS